MQSVGIIFLINVQFVVLPVNCPVCLVPLLTIDGAGEQPEGFGACVTNIVTVSPKTPEVPEVSLFQFDRRLTFVCENF